VTLAGRARSHFKGDDPSSEFASTDSNDHIACIGRYTYRERAMADGERRRPTCDQVRRPSQATELVDQVMRPSHATKPCDQVNPH
jgi:hypothetical protein